MEGLPHEARWWRRERDRLHCYLCPRGCKLRAGQTGFCRVRQNRGGTLYALSYGRPLGLAVDPIETKPLFHFLPGSQVLSFGTAGCTLACRFCQNWSLSQCAPSADDTELVAPERIVRLAEQHHTPVFAEYAADIAHLARARGIHNVMVSNGYIAPAARPEVFADIDAVNVDLKGFSDEFYRRLAMARLGPVLDTLLWLHRETDVWLEVTTLIIPGHNDRDETLRAEFGWIHDQLGDDVPLHLSAFHPAYRMTDVPRTPPATLLRAREIARAAGLRYVYTGNIVDAGGQETRCPGCDSTLVVRTWGSADPVGLRGSHCRHCGATIAGRFIEERAGG
jgi:pyruvate formate lyase activating enzyme